MTFATLLLRLPAGVTAGFTLLCAGTAFAQTATATGTDQKMAAGVDKKLDSPFAAFRLGVVASPVIGVDTGLDFTFPRLRIGAAWATRADLDLSAHFRSQSFGSRRDAVLAVSACQVYTPGGVNRGRFFLGAGLGPSFGPRSGLGGKVFAGVNFTPIVSVEAEAQILPGSQTRLVFMLRASAL